MQSEYVKSYVLSETQKKRVQNKIKYYDEKYKLFKNVVMETQFDAGVFFEDEVSDYGDSVEN